jgi:ABC-type uncharacterized transport system auxiliary subunit
MKFARVLSKIAVGCFAVATIAGCGATHPTKYYALGAPAPPPAAAPSQGSPRLLVGHISSSHLYLEDRVVYASNEVEMGTYEYERWSEPPVDMLQDMLVADLRATGQYRAVSRVGSASRGDYVVRGRLEAFDEIDKPSLAARFSFRLELFDPKSGAVVWSGAYSHDEPVQGKTVSDVVQALDHNVQAGMQQLVSGLGQYIASHPETSQSAQQ